MEVTLQKASKLSKNLTEATKALSVSTTMAVSIYSTDVDADVNKARSAFESNIEKVSAFIAASYEIRQSVSEANSRSGIDSLLTERAEVEAKEKFISNLLGRDIGVDVSRAKRQIETAIARQKVDQWGSDTVAVSVLSEDAIGELKTQLYALRRKKNDITDQLQGTNSSTKVTLSAKTVEALQHAELI